MRYLVTGGAGFMGSNIVEALLRTGQKVRVLDSPSIGRRENIQAFIGDIKLIEGDIRSFSTVYRAVDEIEDLPEERVFNCVCGDRISVRDMVILLNKMMDKDLNLNFADPRAGDVRRFICRHIKGGEFSKLYAKGKIRGGAKAYRRMVSQ